MEQVFIYLGGALLGYAIGNVQFAVIFSRLLHHDDVRSHGSGNAGSTNMLRVYGAKDGVITFIGDLIKGIAGVCIGRCMGGEHMAYCVALGVILGHDFPVLFGFKGGKGVASSFGIILTLDPLFGGIVALVALTVIFLTRTISIASLSGVTTYLILAIVSGADIWEKLFAAIVFLLIFLRHRDNIARIIKGQENKIGGKPKDNTQNK